MFKSHPFTGVGIDRYGENYRTFRDVTAALRTGPSNIVNYAHNAFLQLLATGGLLLFLAYLAIIISVAFAAFKGLKKFKGNDKALFGALVALWFAFQVQAQVSIDQITIAAIGWVLAGSVFALGFNGELIAEKAFQPNTYSMKRRTSMQNSTLVAGGLSIVLVITSFAWLVPIWRADYNIRNARILQGDRGDFNFLAKKKKAALEAVSSAPGEIRYKILAADALVTAKELELARQQLKNALDMDPQSYEAIGYAAQVYERAELIDEAIKIRIVATKMDPNDTDNWLQLGKNLARVGDYQAVNKVIELVAPLASRSTIANDLKALLPAAPTS
jgi:tetratricopeptide (TPR) repeat protein